MRTRLLLVCAVLAAIVGVAIVTLEARTFTALMATPSRAAFQSGDLWRHTHAELVRTNLNDLDTRTAAVEAAYLTASSVTTLTNKTLNSESTGNVLTLPFTVYWPAAVCDQGGVYMPLWSSNGGNEPTYGACWAGTNNQGAGLDFADTATGTIWQQYRLPSDWVVTLDLAIFWRSTATTGNVIWSVQTACTADGETIDPAWNTVQDITDATQGVASRFNTAVQTGVTTTGCAAGEMLFFRIVRTPSAGGDTLGATAEFIGAELKYRRAM